MKITKSLRVPIKKIQQVISGQCFGSLISTSIEWISIDSRSLQNTESTLFFAIDGTNHNGHNYIPALINKGVANFVVSKIPDGYQNKAAFIVVPDTVVALQKLASWYRDAFTFPIIAITGSNGKTIVKEWLNFLLSPEFSIIRSPKSYNSQVGVPLSVFLINEFHNLGIFEAGISTVSEMENLETILKPTIGILTNIGSAHDEGFTSREQKIKEKLFLFKDSLLLIYKKEPLVDAVITQSFSGLTPKLFSWSFEDESATVFIHAEEHQGNQTKIFATYLGKEYCFEIPFTDKASLENAISCFITLLHFEYSSTEIAQRLTELYPVQMRLQVKPAINQCTIIDDSYSCDYQSLSIALDFLEHQKQHQSKTIILSDIQQSGLSSKELYATIFDLLHQNNIQKIIAIGEEITRHITPSSTVFCFKNTEEFLQKIEILQFKEETILIKGARNFHFEAIVKALEYRTHETVLEVNLNAISHNLNYYKSKLQPQTKIMVMVKAFGYGSGGYELAKLLSHHHVNYLGVAFADEGIALRNAGITTPIMVLNPESTSFQSIITNKLEPEIYSLRGLKSFLSIAKELNVYQFPVHIKLDTGMHRLGFEEDQIEQLIALLKDAAYIKVKSILSHLATSDSQDFKEFTLQQIAQFKIMSSQLMAVLPNKPILHIANTSGISNYPEAQFDMVRLGIGLYGVSNDTEETKYLQNVSTLKSVISQIKHIKVGDSVGYSRKFIADKPTTTATIPIGYADGISRALSNGNGYVTIANQKAAIVGNVCMDMLMVDVTNISCNEGDEVIVFGSDPTVSDLAEKLNTIPYEILTGISHRVKRVFFRD